MYSQNSEEKIILDYFKDLQGTLLDIGANDGKTFSNSLALIERGWKGILVEPDADAYEKLTALHGGNPKVICYNLAISDTEGSQVLYKSGTHLNKGDTGLLSTLSQKDYDKWKGQTEYTTTGVTAIRWETFLPTCPEKKFDFITIDAEGMDWAIVQQMNLTGLGCRLISIEHNGEKIKMFNDFFNSWGMTLTHGNAENLIYAK